MLKTSTPSVNANDCTDKCDKKQGYGCQKADIRLIFAIEIKLYPI